MKDTSLAFALVASFVGSDLASAAPQFEEAWQFNYQAPGGGYQASHGLVGTPDGGALTMMSVAPTATGGAGTAVFTRFSENGERVWEFTRAMNVCASAGCYSYQQPNADVDSLGNTYAVVADSSVQFGGTRLLKIDPAGSLVWDVSVSSASLPRMYGCFVKVDSLDRPVVGGTFDIALYPYSAAFRFDATGALDWSVGGINRCDVTGMEIGPNDEVALYGRNDYPQFAQIFFGMIHVYGSNGSLSYIEGLSSDGYGTLNFGTYWGDTVNDVAFDDMGNLHAFTNGSFGSEWYHDGWVGFAIASIDPSGGLMYRTAVDSPRGTQGNRIAVDATQNAYVVGTERVDETFSSDTQANVWKVDASGAVEWQRMNPASQAGDSSARGASVTPAGDLLIMTTDATDTAHLTMDAAGNTQWLATEPTGLAGTVTYLADRHDVLANVDGMAYTQQQLGSAVRITKFVPGGLVGTQYCGPAVPNSSGAGGVIDAIGGDFASENNLTLRLSDLPGNTFAMLLGSQTQGSLTMLGGGQGTLCLGGSIGRFVGTNELRRTLPNGTSSLRVDTTRIPNGLGTQSVSAGQTWNFQAWFRDVNPVVTSNLTNAISVAFQ